MDRVSGSAVGGTWWRQTGDIDLPRGEGLRAATHVHRTGEQVEAPVGPPAARACAAREVRLTARRRGALRGWARVEQGGAFQQPVPGSPTGTRRGERASWPERSVPLERCRASCAVVQGTAGDAGTEKRIRRTPDTAVQPATCAVGIVQCELGQGLTVTRYGTGSGVALPSGGGVAPLRTRRPRLQSVTVECRLGPGPPTARGGQGDAN